jgi:tetratricopeptide (TPR) repeat protein
MSRNRKSGKQAKKPASTAPKPKFTKIAFLADLNLAASHQQAFRFGDAEKVYRQILGKSPRHPEANLALGLLLQKGGHGTPGIEHLMIAADGLPDNLDAQLNAGTGLRQLNRSTEALKYLERAARLNPKNAALQNLLGNIYRESRQPDKAEAALLKAIEIQPDLPEALNNLGALYSEQARVDEAIVRFHEAIRHRPDYYKAYRNLSAVCKYTERDKIVVAMEQLWQQDDLPDHARMELGFALGKTYEDLGETDRAFTCWMAGNKAQRRVMPYSIDRDIEEMAAMRQIFDANCLQTVNHSRRHDVTPIFVVGMPRSGTSLVEQILASHSEVYGAGELSTVRDICWQAVDRFPDDLSKLSSAEWESLGDRYIDHIRTLANGQHFIVDKLPGNVPHIGMIHMMLPHAKVIHCIRDPLDTGLSCYKNHFFSSGLQFTSSLQDLGTYYLSTEALMTHWNQALPDLIYAAQYERLVTESEPEIRKILDYCELPFESNCLTPHKLKRMVATASATQVREPIHTGSIHAWKKYAGQLQPLIDSLAKPSDRPSDE